MSSQADLFRELCHKCGTVRECRTVSHSSGAETICNTCNTQVDFLFLEEYEDDNSEPCGSCEECGTNLYPDDDGELCDQCLWRSGGGA